MTGITCAVSSASTASQEATNMTAINSNRAIRGPVTAVPVVAGKGVRLVADTENNRWVVEADETVLYNANGSPNQTGPWTLSEVPTNFEWIDIVLGTDANGNEVKAQRFKADSSYMKVDINKYEEDPNWKIATMTLVFNQTTMSIKSNSTARFMIASNGSVSVSTAAAQAPFIYQVVGINRIASA